MDQSTIDTRARHTLHALLRARGYRTIRELDDGMLRATDHEGTYPTSESILIVFATTGKLGIKPLRALENKINAEDHLMIIYNRTITSFARQEFDRMEEAGKHVETFDVNKLQFNIMEHALVPPHTHITAPDARKMGLVPEKLPVMLRSDVVARWYGWGKGTVIQTTLCSPEGHTMREYRTVE